MKKASTTTIIGFTTVILCFIILILTLTGLVHSSETMQTQIVQLTSSILILVLGFYFGASHKQEPKTKETMIEVFWDLPLTTTIVEIDGNPITPTAAQDLKNINPNFSVLPDDTNVHVLTVGTTPTSLKGSNDVIYTSVTSEFAGGRPQRPH